MMVVEMTVDKGHEKLTGDHHTLKMSIMMTMTAMLTAFDGNECDHQW